MYRKRMRKRSSKRLFSKTSSVHPKNLRTGIMRGGYRL